MKKFLKSMMISLMIGFPVVIGIIIFLYLGINNNSDHFINAESVTISQSKNPAEPVLESSEEQIQSQNDLSITDTEDMGEQESTNSPVTLSFAGDVYFSEMMLENYDNDGILSIVDEEMLARMKNADLFILNHEFVFSDRGEPMEDKEYTLRTNPKYIKVLQELGTDVVSIANNHTLDFGQEAFLDTLVTLENANISYVGGGKNKQEAVKPVVCTINGQSFAFLAATRVSPSYDWYATNQRPGIIQTYDATEFNQSIEEADSKYDHTIILVHWGIERNEIPEEYQRTLAKGYIDSGADLVIGAHPHVLQGFEYYKNVPIVYSLGNYIFGNRTGDTLLLNATFEADGKLTISMIPCARSNWVLKPIEDSQNLFDHLTDISFDVAISHGGILIH